MRDLFRYSKTDKIIRLSFQIASVLLVCELAYTLFSYFSLPPLIPLFNQFPWGDPRLGLRFEIFFPIVIACLFFIGNLLFLNKIYEAMPLVARMLAITTLLLSMLSFIFIIQTLHIIL